jgi:hypothetical protein
MVGALRGEGLGLGLAERVIPGMVRCGARVAFRGTVRLGLGFGLRLGSGLTAGSLVGKNEGAARLGEGSPSETTALLEDVRSSQPVATGTPTNAPPTTTAAAAGTR